MKEGSSRFDLNLVRAFVTIFETKSVTNAADQLEVTQPTISHSLARLRVLYEDRLFVRGPHGLIPTSVAERVYEQLKAGLTAIESTLDAQKGFDPLSSTRRFRIALSDIGSLFFTPPLLHRFQTVAPRIQVEIVQLSETLLQDLTRGTLDMAIGNLPTLHNHSSNELLFRERYVCLVAAECAGGREAMDFAEFAHARHVMVTSPSSGHALIDNALGARGVRRNVVALVPQFSVLPNLVEDSDLVVVLPSRVAMLYASQRRLRMLELPVPIPDFEVRMHWHTRWDSAPVHRWLREQVRQSLSGL